MNKPPPKHPENVEPYHIIWCSRDGTNDGSADDKGELQGATISSAVWTVPSGITKDSDNTIAANIGGITYPVNTVTTIWLSGGTDGEDYTLKCKIVTSDNRTLVDYLTVEVRE